MVYFASYGLRAEVQLDTHSTLNSLHIFWDRYGEKLQSVRAMFWCYPSTGPIGTPEPLFSASHCQLEDMNCHPVRNARLAPARL